MTATSEDIAPPSPPGALEWVRKNLFSNWFNSLLTILGVTVVYFCPGQRCSAGCSTPPTGAR